MMMEESRIGVKEAAVHDFSKLFPLPDSLVSINSIRTDFVSGRPGTSDQIITSSKTQVQHTAPGVSVVSSGQSWAADVHANFDFIEKLCEECQSLVQRLDDMKLVSHARTNGNMASKDVDEMLSISTDAAETRASLADEKEIVRTFERVSGLERKKSFVLAALSSNREEADKLFVLVEDVNNTIEMFESILWGHIANFFKLAKECPETLVRALMVIEMQEILDRRQVEEDAQTQRSGKMKMTDKNSRVAGRGYRNRCLREIRQSVEARFDNLISKLVMEEDLKNTLEEADSISLELIDIYDHVGPCFPPQYDIFESLVELYTEQFLIMLQNIGERANNLSSIEILKVTGWAERYKEQLQSLGVDEAVASVCAESGSMDTLMNAYVGRMQATMEAWYTNILQTDRLTPPKKTIDGKLWSPAAVHFFRILADEVRVVQENSTDIMLYSIALAVIQIMKDFQAAQRQRLLEPASEFGLEFVCAMVNNNARSYDFALDLSDNVMEALNPRYAKQINFQDACNGFLEISEMSVQKTVNVIFEDSGVKELVAKLYLTEWLEGVVTEDLLDALGDYIEDVEVYLESKSFRRFAEACLEETVVVYVDKFLTQESVIKEETLERLKADEDVLSELFKQMIDSATVEERVQALAELRELASAESVESFTFHYANLLKKHSDCPPKVIEKLVALREGIPRQDAREVVAACEEVYAKRFRNGDLRNPGLVFGRLPSLPKALSVSNSDKRILS